MREVALYIKGEIIDCRYLPQRKAKYNGIITFAVDKTAILR